MEAGLFDPRTVRAQFPALDRRVAGRAAVYLDGPAGTQVPASVIQAIGGVLQRGISNLGGPFAPSREAEELTGAARRAAADFFNAPNPDQIAFGQNMTSLTFAVSRALARTWHTGDEIIVTRLDHDANITPWVMEAEARGVAVRWIDFLPEQGCALDYYGLEEALNARTRLVAVTHASNALGTVVDVRRVTEAAHAVGALVWVDAVHFAPHGSIDVQLLDCDFLVASAYKFFGPHTGLLYGRTEHLEEIDAFKVRPAPRVPPGKWETGTQSFESLAGVTAAIDYLASLGEGNTRRGSLVEAMERIGEYERSLAERFLTGIANLPGVTVLGARQAGRVPTFALSVDGARPDDVQRRLGEQGIFVWAGHHYAVEVMRRLGTLDAGGLVRIGFVHYNTTDELDRCLGALADLT